MYKCKNWIAYESYHHDMRQSTAYGCQALWNLGVHHNKAHTGQVIFLMINKHCEFQNVLNVEFS